MGSDADMWREIEANEVRVWLTPGRTGLWCPTCALPSGYEFAVGRDPATGPRIWLGRCSNDQNHLIQEPK